LHLRETGGSGGSGDSLGLLHTNSDQSLFGDYLHLKEM
jgi:hypothetical protein